METNQNECNRLQEAFDTSNAINDLAGMPFSDRMHERQMRIIAGEITFDEAIEELITALHQK